MTVKKILAITAACGIISISSFAQKNYTLKFDPPVGSSYDVTMKVNSDIKQQFGNMTLNTTAKTLYGVKAAGANKNIVVTYNNVRVEMNGMGQNLILDSDSSQSEMSRALTKTKGKSMNLIIDPNGNIVSASGLDSLSTDPATKSFFNPENLKSTMEQALHIFPIQPVKIGDNWETTVEITSPYKMTSTNTYTLTKVEGDDVYIDVKGKISTNGTRPLEMNGMQLEMEVNGTLSGNMVTDLKTGMFRTSDLDQELNGNVMAGGMTIPITATNKIHLDATKK